MASDNTALILWYAIPAVIGTLSYKKNRWLGMWIGVGVALVAITLFAVSMGP